MLFIGALFKCMCNRLILLYFFTPHAERRRRCDSFRQLRVVFLDSPWKGVLNYYNSDCIYYQHKKKRAGSQSNLVPHSAWQTSNLITHPSVIHAHLLLLKLVTRFLIFILVFSPCLNLQNKIENYLDPTCRNHHLPTNKQVLFKTEEVYTKHKNLKSSIFSYLATYQVPSSTKVRVRATLDSLLPHKTWRTCWPARASTLE